MGIVDKPGAEVDVSPSLVRSLLAEQHPDLVDLELVEVASGWDNVLYRLGDELTVRLPRRALSAPLVAHEQRWLPALAPRLPLPIPLPVRVGVPSEALGYPWRWTIGPWFSGRSAVHEPLADPGAAAEVLGRFVAALHQPAPADAPVNPYRGIPLRDRDDRTVAFIDNVRSSMGGDMDAAVARSWQEHVAIPPWTGPPVWVHGDLHPNNVLVDEGRVAAIIDFGDLTSGDPATDVAIAWLLLPPEVRSTFRDAAEVPDDDTWHRGRGWALSLGLAILAHSADDPVFGRVGRAGIEAVLADTVAP